MIQQKYTHQAFDKKLSKFISRKKKEKDQFDTSSDASSEPPLLKRTRVTNDAESLTHAVSSLATNKEEQEQRILLLAEETHYNQIQENWEHLSWTCSVCEKFLSVGINLPQDIN